jgi:hypothetical protein
MKRRCPRCIAGARTNAKRLMLAVLGKDDLGDQGAESRNFLGSFMVLRSSFQIKSMMQNGFPPGIVTSKDIASKISKCSSITILSINGGSKELIHHVVEELEGACITGFG